VQAAVEAAVTLSRTDGRALVIRGSNGSFSSGADINELLELDQNAAVERSLRAQKLCADIDSAPFSSIALVEGHCVGKGLEVALACRHMIAAANSRFRFPEILLGFLPGSGGERLLKARVIGPVADEMLVTGRWVEAEEACRVGLVEKAVTELPAELTEAAMMELLDGCPRKPFPATAFKVDHEFARTYAIVLSGREARKRLAERLGELGG
jgi:enoyl-CoA hydratase/carnithine racemase